MGALAAKRGKHKTLGTNEKDGVESGFELA